MVKAAVAFSARQEEAVSTRAGAYLVSSLPSLQFSRPSHSSLALVVVSLTPRASSQGPKVVGSSTSKAPHLRSTSGPQPSSKVRAAFSEILVEANLTCSTRRLIAGETPVFLEWGPVSLRNLNLILYQTKLSHLLMLDGTYSPPRSARVLMGSSKRPWRFPSTSRAYR